MECSVLTALILVETVEMILCVTVRRVSVQLAVSKGSLDNNVSNH